MFDEQPEKAAQKADELIKNTYRTLMSRGMKGCYIYCCDDQLQDYLNNRIKTSQPTLNDGSRDVQPEPQITVQHITP